MPVFGVDIRIPTVSALQRSRVHIGMSARVAVSISHPAVIQVPINAVTISTKGKTVTLKKAQGKVTVPVQTGKTSLNSVIITQGLKPGDKVIVPD